MAYTEKALPIGGLNDTKLALATATQADVMAGKTFYAGSKEIKTGELVTTASKTFIAVASTSVNNLTIGKLYCLILHTDKGKTDVSLTNCEIITRIICPVSGSSKNLTGFIFKATNESVSVTNMTEGYVNIVALALN